MARYYFTFPADTKLDYIQPVKAKNIHHAWEIMNFFFCKFHGYGYTATQLMHMDMYHKDFFLPLLTNDDVLEVLDERKNRLL